MIQVLKDIIFGSPGFALGLLSVATVSAGTILDIVWLSLIGVVTTAMASFYAKQAHDGEAAAVLDVSKLKAALAEATGSGDGT